ncbi:hypothetical protein [Anaeroselena agilis]|uniref:Uncharacterized protein n=1 Tax=Anaeroselena agilis TaxID=3063788 RepID=A0ABU3NUZ3_9FIRM|nr:hypothetical protein [Selenomonadales bacterium 4137-cl]
MEILAAIEPVWLYGAVAAAVALLLLAAFLYNRTRGIAGRQRRLADRVARLKRGRSNPETLDLLRRLFSLAHAAVSAKNEQGAYQAVDLIKTVYGHGITRPGEAVLLGALAVRAVRARQLDTAAAVLDAFRLLLKRLPTEEVPDAAGQITTIAAVALREKHNFLAAKAAEITFSLLEKTGWEDDRAALLAAFKVLETIGILALRRRDGDLFREIVTRLDAALPASLEGGPAAALGALVCAWLHRAVQNNDNATFAILADFTARRSAGGLWPSADLAALVKEWHKLAGTASLRPRSTLAPAIAEAALRLALAGADLKRWEASVAGAGQTARMAIQRHGIAEGFALVLPLFEIGRELLALELKFGAPEHAADFRPQALYLIVRESLAVAEFAARQDMVTTVGDILAEFLRCWAGADRANPKAAKRFCQLLAAHWLRSRTRQAKRSAISDELALPVLLTDTDKQRLGFLL